MNKHLFNDIINNPDLLTEKTLVQLQEIIEEYPFFQAGRMLLLKNLHKLDHIKFNSELKHSAAYIGDRSKLFFLLNDLKSPLSGETKVRINAEPVSTAENKVETKKAGEIKDVHDKTVTTTDNYLNASDELIDVKGKSINFDNPNAEIEDNTPELENLVLPTADLLDYEIQFPSVYSLEHLDSAEEEDANSNHSFSDWLQMMKHKKEQSSKPVTKSSDKKTNLIDSFLNSNPKIVPSATKSKKEIDLSEAQLKDDGDIMSETLANIFVKQGHYNKAISILEKLRLKYPEKNAYFARRIKEIKES